MTYIGWYTKEEILFLVLPENPSREDFDTINQEIMTILNDSNTTLSLIIDTNNLKTSYHTATYLRDTQKYMDHRQLDTIYSIANNKLNRLIMTLGFSLCRAHFVQLKGYEETEDLLKKQGYHPTISK